MQQSSQELDRLTQSVLYYPCESCMDALMGNSIFAWLFLDRPNNICGEEKSVVLIPGVCGLELLVCHWLKWMVLLFRLDGNRSNKNKTSHAIFEPAGWLWIFGRHLHQSRPSLKVYVRGAAIQQGFLSHQVDNGHQDKEDSWWRTYW